jgi:hypothetical protein
MRKCVQRVLQTAMFGQLPGHGSFALKAHPPFLALLNKGRGVSPALAPALLQIIGGVDVVIAVQAVVRPVRAALLYVAFWGFVTALPGPLSGMPMRDFVESWPDCCAPLALLPRGWPIRLREWVE